MDFLRKLLATKSIEKLNDQAENSELGRTLTAFDLFMMGVGGIIGTGIFVLTGQAAYAYAGPAVVVSFLVSGLAAAMAAMSYAELSGMIPIAGSAYTYSYATMGEFVGWIIGWDLILEYLVGAATVAVGWSSYTVAFIGHIVGFDPESPSVKRYTDAALYFDEATQSFELSKHGIINIPAIVVTLFTTAILIFGIKESARLNAVIVFVKVLVILLFIFTLIPKIDTANWTPFFPENQGTFSKYGVTGMLTAATTVFFAYIGFDAVSTTAQEARNPQRDLPIGIIGSLAFCTVLYLAVCMVMTGVLNYTKLDGARPLSKVIDHVGWTWLSIIVEIGAISGLMSVMLITLMGQPRIFFAMGHDGLLPAITTRVHPKFKTPWFTTLVSGIACATAAGVLPIGVLGEMTSIGTLFAFVLVNIGVIILRYRRPDIPRRFKVPFGPWIFPFFGALLSTALIGTATPASLLRLAIWMAVGIVVYFSYGFWNSRINNPEKWVGKDEMVEKPDF